MQMQYFKLHFCRKYCRPGIHLTFSIVNVDYLAEKPLTPAREPTVRMFFYITINCSSAKGRFLLHFSKGKTSRTMLSYLACGFVICPFLFLLYRPCCIFI